MIAVIADDFTGAAEIAGIILRYGLSVTVYLDNVVDADTDVVIISTDSRSMQKAAAVYCTAEAVETVMKYRPSLLYKKIDSVLRGYVLEELKVQMELTEKNKIFLLPANPTLGRTISDGEYFIQGKEIAATAFAFDPEFPVKNSKVVNMLNDDTIEVVKHNDWLPLEGIVVGEATTSEDVLAWVNIVDETWVLAGAGDFYTALLEKEHTAKPQPKMELLSPHLYVCGTAFEERKQFLKSLDCCLYMQEENNEAWLQLASVILKEQNRLVIAINEANQTALELRTAMAKLVNKIVVRENVKEIFIEGGSTAAAVLEEMHIKKLIPVNELSRGVVRMKAGELFITVKPGSYQLPIEILDIYI